LRHFAIFFLTACSLMWPKPAWLAEQHSNIEVGEPWSWATPPTAKVGAAYLTMRNDGEAVDSLLGATSPIARRVEIHQMSTSDGVSRMQQLRVLDLPVGSEIIFSSGGMHFMLIDLVRPLKEGETFPVQLHFKGTGTIEVEVVVRAMSLKHKSAGNADPGPTEQDHEAHGTTQ
jgi:hypothetical protein